MSKQPHSMSRENAPVSSILNNSKTKYLCFIPWIFRAKAGADPKMRISHTLESIAFWRQLERATLPKVRVFRTVISSQNLTFFKTHQKVKLARHVLTNREVAIKVIDKKTMNQSSLNKLFREVRIMKLLHHPNVGQFHLIILNNFSTLFFSPTLRSYRNGSYPASCDGVRQRGRGLRLSGGAWPHERARSAH